MYGKIIFVNKEKGVFVQRDKNLQVCNLYNFDRKTKKIGERVYPEILNVYRGRPLYTAWNGLLEAIKEAEK
jgi:hypothetical protein